MSRMVFAFYKYIVVPIGFFLLQLLRPFLSGKLREMIDDKNHGRVSFVKGSSSEGSREEISGRRPLWIHAASGEIEYARPVIREFKKLYPQIPVVVTYSSPSAKKILRGLTEIDAWLPLPWDFSFALKSFLLSWKPRLLLVARTDLWPVLSEVCCETGLPSVLFSATFAENSSRLSGLTRYLTRFSLQNLSAIYCVSEEDRQNLSRLSLQTPVEVLGDTRFDQVFYRLDHPRPLRENLRPAAEDFVFIAGSTWPEDEAVVLPAVTEVFAGLLGLSGSLGLTSLPASSGLSALSDLSSLPGSKSLSEPLGSSNSNAPSVGRFKIILAPHETTAEHLQSLTQALERLGLIYVRYSQADSWGKASVLLIDQVGVLAELYTWADLAFVGGSFKKQVHSVMEPLAAGLPVVLGPYHHNNREALLYQKLSYSEGPIVQVVSSAPELSQRLQRELSIGVLAAEGTTPRATIKSEIRQEVNKNRHSTERVLAALQPWIL